MAGHSKWSKVKHIKGPLDQKRGQLFSKLAKEITVAAKLGGGDPGANIRLRSAILAARTQSMPNDNIERAIKRGTGDGGETGHLEEIVYEGYAPAGVALIIEAATDNKNRTAADLRSIFSRHHGNLANSGSVSYLFRRKGQITVPQGAVEEDKLLEAALDAGAEDVNSDGGHHVVTTAHDRLYAVSEALRKAGIDPDAQKLTYIPETTIQITDESAAAQVIRLCDALEENDDVQNVHANFEVTDDLLAKVSA
jgi:YebC/PmpR family DNA-binding regulatory protein